MVGLLFNLELLLRIDTLLMNFQNNFRKFTVFLQAAIFGILLLLSACSGNESTESNHTNWQFYSQRSEIAPAHKVDIDVKYQEMPTLALSGDGKDYTNGSWVLDKEVTAGKFYEFKTYFKYKNIDNLSRTVLTRIDWLGKDGKRVYNPEYPKTLREQNSEGWNVIQLRCQAPENAVTARLEQTFRWDSDGSVNFSEATLKEVKGLERKVVRLATVKCFPQEGSSYQKNLELFANHIKTASKKDADIVCLPEAITMVGTERTMVEASESIPGPTTEFLGKVAKENHIWIVAGIIEREGPVVYNTAVLLDKTGKLAGKYRKVSLPREEIESGITPGNSYPVFDTDFGRIGIMICWDLQFPEVMRALSVQGAEVVFLPIWGGFETLARARAIENQVYLVTSSYDMQSGIYNMEGALIAKADTVDPVVVVELDLNKTKYWPFLGDLKGRIPREIPDAN
jgi:predicted amidohydrolase